jgi:ABC-type bacteriocin/lantibiotic exporter with double-glycine peptidase domain
VQQAKYIFWGIHECWTSVVAIIICFSIIGNKLYSALVFGILLLVILTLVNVFISKKMIDCYKTVSTHKDKRISLSTDVFQGIKSIKYLSWEEIFQRRISDIRKMEFGALASYKAYNTCEGVFWNTFPSLMLFLTLVWYVHEGNNLYDANVFTVNKYLLRR